MTERTMSDGGADNVRRQPRVRGILSLTFGRGAFRIIPITFSRAELAAGQINDEGYAHEALPPDVQIAWRDHVFPDRVVYGYVPRRTVARLLFPGRARRAA